MTQHAHIKKHTIRKMLLAATLVLLGLFAATYVYTPSVPKTGGGEVATSTPLVYHPAPGGELKLSITPKIVEQGEPALLTVEGLNSTSSVKSFTFDNRPLV